MKTKPSAHTAYQTDNARSLATPRGVAVLLGHFSLLRGLAASVVWGTAEPAIRPSKTIFQNALNGQTAI